MLFECYVDYKAVYEKTLNEMLHNPLHHIYIFMQCFVYCSGIKGADEDEIRAIASTPHSTHVYSVLDFDLIKDVQQQLITQVCLGVEDQLSVISSGEEGMTQHNKVAVYKSHSSSSYVSMKPHVCIYFYSC